MSNQIASEIMQDPSRAAGIVREAKQESRRPKQNDCWTELQGLRNNMIALLVNHSHIGAMAKIRELVELVEDKPTLRTNLEMFKRDLMQLNTELEEIYSKHKDKTGGTQDPDEHYFSLQLYEMYILWQQKHDAVLGPVALHILEQFNQAEVKLHAKRAAAAHQSQVVEQALNDNAASAGEVKGDEVKLEERATGELLKDALTRQDTDGTQTLH